MLLQTQQWLSRFYKSIRILSIDIALGAISVSLFAKDLFESIIPSIYWILLPLSVWAIYTFDHITDGIKAKRPLQKPTYLFHLRHRTILNLVLIAVALLILLLFSLFFYKPIFFIALVGGGWVGLYFLVHKTFSVRIRNWFPKELFISTGYMIGTFGVPLLTKTRMVSRSDIFVIIGMFLLVLTNVFIYSYFEFEEDKRNEFAGIIQVLGQTSGYKFISYFAMACNILCMYLCIGNIRYTSFILMSLIMSYMIFKPLFFLKNQRYGKIVDALFLLPGLIVILLK